MPHTFSRNHIHVIFSTKDRRKTIPKELQPRLWAYLAGICKNHETVHLLFHLPPKLALAKAVQLLKSNG